MPSFRNLTPASAHASAAARGASKKSGTRPELLLRRALWNAGCRYRKNVSSLPGKPDIVFVGARIAVFCDGDFWHGREWHARKAVLRRGHNSAYWVAKIERNIARDDHNNELLRSAGWHVLRFWESDIKDDVDSIVTRVRSLIAKTVDERDRRNLNHRRNDV